MSGAKIDYVTSGVSLGIILAVAWLHVKTRSAGSRRFEVDHAVG